MKFLVDTLLKLLPRVLPILGIFAIPQYKWLAVTGYIIFFVLFEYYASIQPERQLRKRIHKILDFHFKTWVDSARYNRIKPSLRVNVMLMNSRRWAIYKRLSALGIPSFLVNILEPRFVQVYEYGMSGHPDANLSLRASSGFCGWCFQRQRKDTFYVDLQPLTRQDTKLIYGMTDDEHDKTQHITAIACATLVRKRKRLFGRDLPEEEYFGTLNIDATDEIGAKFLQQPKVLERIEALSVIVEHIYA